MEDAKGKIPAEKKKSLPTERFPKKKKGEGRSAPVNEAPRGGDGGFGKPKHERALVQTKKGGHQTKGEKRIKVGRGNKARSNPSAIIE